MKKIIYSLFIAILFISNCKTQEDGNYSLININPTEVEILIDSIWKEVVSWDGDTSQMTILKREQYATNLENYFLKHHNENTVLVSPEGKALLYSFFIRYRNDDYQKIINSFNTNLSDISPMLWHAIYPLYLKSMKKAYKKNEDWIVSLDQIAESDTSSFHKVVIWWDLGMYHYYIKEDTPSGRKYFAKIVDMKPFFPKGVIFDIITKAESTIRQLDDLQLGEKAPNFCAQDIDNNEVCFKSDQKKVVLLDFWATWCVPCIEELPKIKRIYKKYKDRKDFQVIGISLNRNIDDLRKFIKEYDMKWPQIFEGADMKRKGKITLLYNGIALPTYYVIGKDGLFYYNFDSRKNGVDIEDVVNKLMEE